MSNLEAVVLGIMAIFVSVIGIVGKMTGAMVKKSDCEQTREHCGKIQAANILLSAQKADTIQRSIDDLKESNIIQYEMLRAIIVHMPGLSDSKKTEIINNRRGKDDTY
jgi:hypothetical protein